MSKYVRAFAPGRVEVAGNHCDHQHGCIVAGAVALGVSALAQPNGAREVRVLSEPKPGPASVYVPVVARACAELGVRETVGLDDAIRLSAQSMVNR